MESRITLIIIAAAGAVFSQPDNGSVEHTGQATYYYATGDGNCMFGPSPNDLMVCAMNNTEYAGASVCGASIHIKGPKGEVTVRIVDRCPECPVGNVDLSKQAFMKIADTIQGRVNITWSYVETQVAGPIEYRIKTGSNAWWIGVQVLNHRTPVVKLEAMNNGVWVALPRQEYNYFVDSAGLGPGPFTFRVTDFYGEQLVDMNIPLKPDSITSGSANFTSHAAVAERVARQPYGAAARAMLVAGVGCRHALWRRLTGRCTIYTVKGTFVGRIDAVDGGPKGETATLPTSGIFIIKPAGK